ncbi:DUF2116 family Zn-ribbon domain-containing protein [Indibacter alkaliphilus]|nr:DUF2116 family Zn-ribbon domain-containing protein [Indibacter alkaliphilus]
MELSKRHCQYCGSAIHGRSDKKFCNDACRSSYNNQRRDDDADEVKNIQYILRTNRKILMMVLEDGVETVKVPKERLSQLGFNFKYHTHHFQHSPSMNFWFCFDYGFLDFWNGWVLVVRDMGESYLQNLNRLFGNMGKGS